MLQFDEQTVHKIMDEQLYKLLVCPLAKYFKSLYLKQLSCSGELQLLSENISFVQKKSMYDLGVNKNIAPLSKTCLKDICYSLMKMQVEDEPYEKLKHIINSIKRLSISVSNKTYNLELIIKYNYRNYS